MLGTQNTVFSPSWIGRQHTPEKDGGASICTYHLDALSDHGRAFGQIPLLALPVAVRAGRDAGEHILPLLSP